MEQQEQGPLFKALRGAPTRRADIVSNFYEGKNDKYGNYPMTLVGTRLDPDGVERRFEESKASREAWLETRKLLNLGKQAMLDHLAQFDGIVLSYYILSIFGHGLRPEGIRSTFYITADYEDSEQEHEAYGLTGREIKARLPAAQVSQTLLTDFCRCGNYFELRYTLELSDGGAKWVETPEWFLEQQSLESDGYSYVDTSDYAESIDLTELTEDVDEDWVDIPGWMEVAATPRTVHFAACMSSEPAWENNLGGYFTRATTATWNEPLSLASRLKGIRECVKAGLCASGDRLLRQTPQIFSDTKLDLTIVYPLGALVLGPEF